MNSRGRNGARRVDDDRNILVSGVVAAVLGDLGATRVDDANPNATEHVRVAWLPGRHAEEVTDGPVSWGYLGVNRGDPHRSQKRPLAVAYPLVARNGAIHDR